MNRLVIDVGMLKDLGTDLGKVATEFAEANVRSDDIAEAVGHDKLAQTVRSFAHGWDNTREHMTEQITFLSEAATASAEVFEEVDGELVMVLEYLEGKLNADLAISVNGKLVAATSDHPVLRAGGTARFDRKALS